jgi:transposase InsO family protein
MGVVAEPLGLSARALTKWVRKRSSCELRNDRRGRPPAIPAAAAWAIRRKYKAHYHQWGPQVLALWATREGIGTWSPSTIARLIAPLKPEPEARPNPIRYEITAPMVMWSEDGAGFRQRGEKQELLVIQDEASRYKVNHRLVSGPANGEDVCGYLEEAFEKHGAPLLLKHDGGWIFHTDAMEKLLERWGVEPVTSPPYYPQYNGKKERSIRDIKSYERAMRSCGAMGTLADRLDTTIHDLNEVRPRPVLKGRTAREVFDQDRTSLPSRDALRRTIDRWERKLKKEASDREHEGTARRRAVERALLEYGLMEISGGMSTESADNAGT